MSANTDKLIAAMFKCFRSTAFQLVSAESAFADGRVELGLSRVREAREVIEEAVRREDWRLN